eukprot:GEMP01032302.1.p1 GENE.GEMP01032302.1~~GEMP01032302.1.p1  ORF type:complete len:322 (+),score=51.45 GEMP01032302.1:35-1000(+)
MEKYRQFADEKTGLSPFVPLWSNYRMPLWRKIGQCIGLPVVLVRLALFIICVVYLLFASCLVVPLKIVPSIQVLLQRLLFPIGCRLALVALGFLGVHHDPADHRRLKIRPGPMLRVTGVSTNEVVLVNYQSCVDILYLGLFGINQFVFVNKEGALARPISLLRAFFAASHVGGIDNIPALKEFPSGAVAIFPEGVRTTGIAILPFAKGAERATSICGLQYSAHGSYTAHHTIGTSVYAHLAWMLWNWTHAQEVRGTWLPNEAVKRAFKEQVGDKEAFIRTLLSRLVHRSVEVEGEWLKRHEGFVKYWRETQQGGYITKKNK